MMEIVDDGVREYIESQIDNVQLDGLCPICKTGRSQNGECWGGHIVIDVHRSSTKKAAQHSAQGAEMPNVKPFDTLAAWERDMRPGKPVED